MKVRRAAVAGTWYPGDSATLAREIDRYLGLVEERLTGRLVGLVSPHAGLVYSGPVAAHAYRLVQDLPISLVVLVGPSHHVGFEGVAVWPSGGFATPFGVAEVDEGGAAALMAATPLVRAHEPAHVREHSLEMQLPFIQRVAPGARILPLLMGFQTPATSRALADALATVLGGRTDVLLVASSDLSHYHEAATAARLDRVVMDCIEQFDADALQAVLTRQPEHACGGGPMVAVMRTARALGARAARVLCYADSGDVSGDKQAVVGYLAAAFVA
jgi:AmmeMemoRadiSam system protein B